MDKVKTKRIEQNMTQADLAASSGVSQAAISKVESGAIVPSLKLAQKIAHALNCKLDELFP